MSAFGRQSDFNSLERALRELTDALEDAAASAGEFGAKTKEAGSETEATTRATRRQRGTFLGNTGAKLATRLAQGALLAGVGNIIAGSRGRTAMDSAMGTLATAMDALGVTSFRKIGAQTAFRNRAMGIIKPLARHTGGISAAQLEALGPLFGQFAEQEVNAAEAVTRAEPYLALIERNRGLTGGEIANEGTRGMLGNIGDAIMRGFRDASLVGREVWKELNGAEANK